MRPSTVALALAVCVTLAVANHESKEAKTPADKPKTLANPAQSLSSKTSASDPPARFPRCFETNTDYPGNDLTGKPLVAPTAKECQRQCIITSGCKYWSYQPAVKECWLKTHRTGVVRVGVISGEMSCNDCVFPNWEFPGGDMGKPRLTESALDCAKRCRLHGSCVGWSYKPRMRECYLKHTKGKGVATGAISGPKTCPSALLMSVSQVLSAGGSCGKANTDYSGSSMPGSPLPSHSAEHCRQECRKHGGCYFWAYQRSDNECWLKGPQAKAQASGAVSGAKNCRGAGCRHTNTDYPGDDIQGSPVKVKSVDQCQEKCEDSAPCQFWSYQVAVSECWLKYGKANTIHSGAIGGPATCELATSGSLFDAIFRE